jgi:hypothetical protein
MRAGQSFTRRERCADVLAQMKASSLSLYWLHRDFDVAAVANATTGEMQPAPGVGGVSARNISVVLQDFMVRCTYTPCMRSQRVTMRASYTAVSAPLQANARSFLQLPPPSPGEDHPDGIVHYNRCMADASTLSYLNEKLAFRAKCVCVMRCVCRTARADASWLCTRSYANGAMGRANEYLRGALALSLIALALLC